MYLCICNAINQRDVRTAYEQGARTVSSVYKVMSCVPQCGECSCAIRDELKQHREDHSAQQVSTSQNLDPCRLGRQTVLCDPQPRYSAVLETDCSASQQRLEALRDTQVDLDFCQAAE